MVKEILLLGNDVLYQTCEEVKREELPYVRELVADLHDTLAHFRKRSGFGRAIAAPQIGVSKRVIYMFIDRPTVFINPQLTPIGDEMMEIMDDCLSFPNLLVKLMRHKCCVINYMDLNWHENELIVEGDLSELLQHEYDHLDGILATMRADSKSLFYHPKHG